MSNDIKYINSDNRRSVNIRDVIDDKKNSGEIYSWALSKHNLLEANLRSGINLDLLMECHNQENDDEKIDDLVKAEQQGVLVALDMKHSKSLPPILSSDDSIQSQIDVLGHRVQNLRNINTWQTKLDHILTSIPKIDKKIDFVGCEITTISEKNLNKMNDESHVLSVKLDGIRANLVADGTHLLIVTRDNSVRHFSTMSQAEDFVLDVELVLTESNMQVVVLDIIRSKGVLCCADFERRYMLAASKYLFLLNMGYPVLCQQYFPCDRVDLIYEDGGQEGLVFTNIRDPYKIGFSSTSYKWKPGGDTVDVLVVDCGDSWGLASGIFNDKNLVGHHIQRRVAKSHQYKVGNIIEFRIIKGAWTFIRVRVDKKVPNSTDTFNIVARSVCGLSFETLYYYMRKYVQVPIKDKFYSFYKMPKSIAKVVYDYVNFRKIVVYERDDEGKSIPLPVYKSTLESIELDIDNCYKCIIPSAPLCRSVNDPYIDRPYSSSDAILNPRQSILPNSREEYLILKKPDKD